MPERPKVITLQNLERFKEDYDLQADATYYKKAQGEAFEEEVNERVSHVESELSNVASGSPKGVYATLSDLEAAYPTGANGIYVVTADGHWYYWNGTGWADGGVYQSTAIANSSIEKIMLNEELTNNIDYLYEKLFDKIEVVENLSSYRFTEGEYYCVTINATNVTGQLQFGIVESPTATGYIDSTQIFNTNLTNYKWIFKASGNSTIFYTYNPSGANISYKIERLVLPINKKVGKVLTSNVSNGKQYIPFYFEEGKTYEVIVSSVAGTQTLQLWTGFLPGGSYYDSSIVLTNVAVTNFKWRFTASHEATCIFAYLAGTYTSNEITIKEYLDEDEPQKVNNAVVLSRFDGVLEGSDVEATGWTQNNDHISISHSGGSSTWFTDGCVSTKYVTAYDRVLIYDFVPNADCLPCFYTAPADLETFFAQGWCIHLNFSVEAVVISNYYGGSTTLPSNYTSYSIPNMSNYGGKKLRAIISRNKVRGINFKLIALEGNVKICDIDTPYSSNIVPPYGLGYDKMACCSLQGTLELYAMKEIIPNADKTFLYIVGDSITEGVGVKPENAYAYMCAKEIPNTIVSGRGGGTIVGVSAKLETEVAKLKPKYVMVTIGTNGGNNAERLAYIVERIRYYGAEPIINTIPCTSTSIQASVNAQILALGVKCVRMDIATALNYDLNDGPDASLFVADGVHPNEAGHKRMFEMVKQQMPELFNLR